MPISDGRTLVVTIGKALPLLWLLLLLQLSLYQAHQLPRKHSDNIWKHEQETFRNSHILEQELEKSVYLFRGETKNLTFTFEHAGMMTLVVTPCASELQWSLFEKSFVDNKRDYRLHGQRKPTRPQIKIAQFESESRRVFSRTDAPKGKYVLSLTSVNSDSYAKIMVTRNITYRNIYPSLPADKSLHTIVRRRKLTVSWKPIPWVFVKRHSVKYCVSISQIKNFKTHCSALAHKKGDKGPTYTEWGFSWEKKKNKQLKDKARPIKKVKKKYMFYKCVTGKTSLTYKKLRKGKKYFVDVFVVDKDSTGSSAYIGTSVGRKKKKRVQKRNFAVLTMGQTRTVNLKYTKGVQLNVNQTLPKFVIDTVPCGGSLVVYYNGNKQTATRVRRYSRRIVTSATAGTYRIAFRGKRKKSSYVSISASSHTKSKVHQPESMNVTVHRAQTSCSNVTLQWMESNTTQTYCLYKQVVSKSNNPKSIMRQSCLSPSERSKSERVFCKKRRSKGNRQRRVYTVPGLSRATTYQFDLYIGDKKAGMIPYQSVKETTTTNC